MPNPREQNIGAGYSLWLVDHPASPFGQRMTELIHEVAAHYETHSFKSHVTLIGNILWDETSMGHGVKELAVQMRPIPVELETFGSSELYFQRFFARVKPNDSLAAYRRMAEWIFDMKGDSSYMPHHSFVYGDLSAVQVRQLEQHIKSQLILPQRFLARSLELWSTQGPVNEWALIQAFSLYPESS